MRSISTRARRANPSRSARSHSPSCASHRRAQARVPHPLRRPGLQYHRRHRPLVGVDSHELARQSLRRRPAKVETASASISRPILSRSWPARQTNFATSRSRSRAHRLNVAPRAHEHYGGTNRASHRRRGRRQVAVSPQGRSRRPQEPSPPTSSSANYLPNGRGGLRRLRRRDRDALHDVLVARLGQDPRTVGQDAHPKESSPSRWTSAMPSESSRQVINPRPTLTLSSPRNRQASVD